MAIGEAPLPLSNIKEDDMMGATLLSYVAIYHIDQMEESVLRAAIGLSLCVTERPATEWQSA